MTQDTWPGIEICEKHSHDGIVYPASSCVICELELKEATGTLEPQGTVICNCLACKMARAMRP